MRLVRVIALCFAISVIVTSTGCSQDKEDTTPAESDVGVVEEVTSPALPQARPPKDIIKEKPNSYYKIKSKITKGDRRGLFAVITDSVGNGSGTFEMLGVSYPVTITDGSILINISDTTALEVTNLTWDMKLPTDSKKYKLSDKQDYIRELSGFEIASTYADAESAPNLISQTVQPEETVDVQDLLERIEKFTQGIGTTAGAVGELIDSLENDKGEQTAKKDTENKVFYVNSDAGIKIRDRVFSVGDVINPLTYFFDEVPEGITEATEYHNDKPVTVTYYSYIEGAGRVEFKTVDGIVCGIHTTCVAEFAGFTTGDDSKDLAHKLGARWNEKRDGKYIPPIEGMVTESSLGTDFGGTVGGINWAIKTSKNVITEFNVYRSISSLH